MLNESIDKRGTLLRDYRTPYGVDGAYRNELRLIGQPGKPCPCVRDALSSVSAIDPAQHAFLPVLPEPERRMKIFWHLQAAVEIQLQTVKIVTGLGQ